MDISKQSIKIKDMTLRATAGQSQFKTGSKISQSEMKFLSSLPVLKRIIITVSVTDQFNHSFVWLLKIFYTPKAHLKIKKLWPYFWEQNNQNKLGKETLFQGR